MDNLSESQKQLRVNIRAFLLTATIEQMVKEIEISEEKNDRFRVDVIKEMLREDGICGVRFNGKFISI